MVSQVSTQNLTITSGSLANYLRESLVSNFVAMDERLESANSEKVPISLKPLTLESNSSISSHAEIRSSDLSDIENHGQSLGEQSSPKPQQIDDDTARQSLVAVQRVSDTVLSSKDHGAILEASVLHLVEKLKDVLDSTGTGQEVKEGQSSVPHHDHSIIRHELQNVTQALASLRTSLNRTEETVSHSIASYVFVVVFFARPSLPSDLELVPPSP